MSRTTQRVRETHVFRLAALDTQPNPLTDYPRTLRTWGRRLNENLRQEVISATHPALLDPVEYAVFKRKWEYLFVYAAEGFTGGYITCHMLTFIRAVRLRWPYQSCWY